jgi:hypothetical protein
MAYYIFLISLRSLEEFRKNPHVKIPLNLLLQISKALVNSKIQFLIQKSFFLAFGPANLAACSASGPASPPAAPSSQAKTVPAGPSSPHVGRVLAGNSFSLSDHAFLSRPPLPRLFVNQAPPVRFTPSPRRPTLVGNPPFHRCPAPQMPPSFYSPPSSLSPLNPLETEP